MNSRNEIRTDVGMANENDVVNVGLAAERFFRLYYTHCTSPSQDTLFSLLEAGRSLNDRMNRGANLNFFDFSEFTALKCLKKLLPSPARIATRSPANSDRQLPSRERLSRSMPCAVEDGKVSD